jgi:hypothetical protein
VIALSLFDYTGVMLEPWLEAGYQCHLVDIQHPGDDTLRMDGMRCHNWDLSTFPNGELLKLLDEGDVAFLSMFPPCTHLSVSGARWMKGKGLRALEESISYFATCTEVADFLGAPYCIENPLSTISTYWRESDHVFHPAWYAGYSDVSDNYTKETHLWVGNGFVMPERRCFGDLFDGPDTTYIHHQPPGEERANIRSATPRGFARAVFEANHAKTEGKEVQKL